MLRVACSGVPISVAKIDVKGKYGPIWKSFKINPDDACGNYGFSCPVAANQDRSLKITLPVKNIYPKVSIEVLFKLLDENQNDIFCITFPAQIRDE